jgi:hypothetical protein
MQRFIRSFLIAFAMVVACVVTAHSQEIKVTGGFLIDSARIGEPVPYYLTARYPSRLTVVFPDSSFQFSPFEFGKKKYFTTRTEGAVSLDSVVYELATFETDFRQICQLPVFVVASRDCTAYTPAADTLFLKALVTGSLPDTVQAQNLPLKTNTTYEPVIFAFNYPILLIIVGVVLLLALIGWLIFGKQVRRYFRAKRLLRAHHQFVTEFTQHVEHLKQTFSSGRTEQAVFLWKRYLEQLERKPFTKLTSREIGRSEQNDQLGHQLSILDQAIYGRNTQALEPLQDLRMEAERRFNVKLEEIKHG